MLLSSTLLLTAVLLLVRSYSSPWCLAFQTIIRTSSSSRLSFSPYFHHSVYGPTNDIRQQRRRSSSLAMSGNDDDGTTTKTKTNGVVPNVISRNSAEDLDDEDGILQIPPPRSITTAAETERVKLFQLENAFENDGKNVVGTKFFGGNSIKEELYIAEEEEMAVKLIVKDYDATTTTTRQRLEYNRFDDAIAFTDTFAQRVGKTLQMSINRILYNDDDDEGSDMKSSSYMKWMEDPALLWDTPFPQSKKISSSSSTAKSTPLTELATANEFYNQLDIAILACKTIETAASDDTSINVVEIRWDIGIVWPNPWESRILLTGSSILKIRVDEKEEDGGNLVVLSQRDMLDGGNDIVGKLAVQLPPRFWDVYHIGMTPCAELDPRYDALPSSLTLPSSSTATLQSLSMIQQQQGKRRIFSEYNLAYLPPRLVTQPSFIDNNGRDGRAAQALPNHAFTTAIRTMGPSKDKFVPVSPIEVSISKVDDASGSLVRWTVPVPPEFASNLLLPLPVISNNDEEEEEDGINYVPPSTLTINSDGRPKFTPPATASRTNRPPPIPPVELACQYTLRPTRLVATLPYSGNPQDEEVTAIRKRLYDMVVERDGYIPKLDPITKRPIFFFWMNDTKACFTRQGGLGMAVYEWRAKWSKSNEVGIELEP